MIESNVTLSIVMPCLNEAKTLASCIRKARTYLLRQNFLGEIIVVDNGSTDESSGIAKSLGAKIVTVSQRGYGSALQAGIGAADIRPALMRCMSRRGRSLSYSKRAK